MKNDSIVEIFGRRMKIVEDKDGSGCRLCCFESSCRYIRGHFKDSLMCKDRNGNLCRHFVDVDNTFDENELK